MQGLPQDLQRSCVLYITYQYEIFIVTLGFSAGVMTSLDELLPASKRYDEAHLSIYELIGGMAVMALSLLLFYITVICWVSLFFQDEDRCHVNFSHSA